METPLPVGREMAERPRVISPAATAPGEAEYGVSDKFKPKGRLLLRSVFQNVCWQFLKEIVFTFQF